MKEMIKKFMIVFLIIITSTSSIIGGCFDRKSLINNGIINSYSNLENESEPKSNDFDYYKSLITSDKSYYELYEQTIEFIKFHEGFAGGKEYNCPSGHRTIGYGHVVLSNEKFPETITKSQGDSILRKDFNSSLRMAKKLSPRLEGSKLLAVAHFCFAKGAGNYSTSTLRELIDSELDPSEEFLKWCKYRSNGNLVKSTHSLNIRRWEIKMFNN